MVKKESLSEEVMFEQRPEGGGHLGEKLSKQRKQLMQRFWGETVPSEFLI